MPFHTPICASDALSKPSAASRPASRETAQGVASATKKAAPSATAQHGARPQSTVTSAIPASRIVAFLSIAMVGCLVDLMTKRMAFERLGMPGGKTYWLVQDFFGFQTSLNEGALFGMGQGQVWLFGTLSIVAAACILYWLFIAGGAASWIMTVSLGAIMAGVLGNLYDRAGLHGLEWHFPKGRVGQPVYAVRDWILFEVHSGDRVWTWPNFNIADSLLVVGIALLVWHAWAYGEASRPKVTPPAHAA